MGHIEQLRSFLAGTAERFEVGPDGESIDLNLGDIESGAVLVVAGPTDALKEVRRGRIESSIDRGQVWEVIGYSLDRAVAEILVGGTSTEDWLVDAAAAGLDWEVIDRSVAP